MNTKYFYIFTKDLNYAKRSPNMKQKIIRVTTIPGSLNKLLTGQLKFMSEHYEVIGVSGKGGDELENVSLKENIRVFPVEMTRKITPFKDLVALYKLFVFFKRERPFIVHSHTPKAGTLSMLAAWLTRVPHRLHTIAGLPLVEAKGSKRLLLNFVEKITYACATKIYPNSFGLVDIILENKFTNKNKLQVIGEGSSNGIDTTEFNPSDFKIDFKNKLRNKLDISENDFVFIYVGRFVTDKGTNELVNAFTKLNVEYKNIKLLLVGMYEDDLDPLHTNTLKMIKEDKNIITTDGWVADVRPYFAIANALTFPSYREGFPNVVMQAAAMELPCVVTNINGCNEIVKHNETGIIIPTKDTNALFDAMIYMLNHKKETQKMGLKSRNHIISNFERKEVWNSLLKEYKQLK